MEQNWEKKWDIVELWLHLREERNAISPRFRLHLPSFKESQPSRERDVVGNHGTQKRTESGAIMLKMCVLVTGWLSFCSCHWEDEMITMMNLVVGAVPSEISMGWSVRNSNPTLLKIWPAIHSGWERERGRFIGLWWQPGWFGTISTWFWFWFQSSPSRRREAKSE